MAKAVRKPRESDGDDQPPMTEVERWIEEIDRAGRDQRTWEEQVDQIVKRYKDERDDGRKDDRRYNVLWSIVETMKPLVYNDAPQPFVTRRHNDRDPVARDASMILQRAISYTLDGDELHDAMEEARLDYLLGSRGVIWFKYAPYFSLRESEEKTYLDDVSKAPEGVEIKKDRKGSYYHRPYEEKVFEEVDVEHVHYRDLRHGPAAKWRHVPWVARRVLMTRRELNKRFGEKIGKQVPLTILAKSEGGSARKENMGDEAKGLSAKAEVWEVWDRIDRCVKWLCPHWKVDFLDKQDDILGLDGFFPCPRPAYGTKTNESLIPKPDYLEWQDVALELDEVTLRIKLLTEALRVAGVYDKSAGETMKRLVTHTRENAMIPVDNWALFAERGGLKGAIDFVPIEQVMLVLDKLYIARERLLKELYDITGISDIVRGASDPRETAKAQQIKGSFANKRLVQRQNTLARMAREGLEIIAQIICKHYSDDMIRQISSAEQIIINPETQQFDPARFDAALKMLRTSALRRFRIKIDERKLATADIAENREEGTMFLQGVSQFLQAAMPMAQTMPGSGPMLAELLMYAVRMFPLARSTEAAIEDSIQKLVNAPPQQQSEQKAGEGAAKIKGPEELAIEREKLAIDREKLGVEKQKLMLEERRVMLEHQYKMAQLGINQQSREREAQIRESKLISDTQAKIAQVQTQREGIAAQDRREQMNMQMQLDAQQRQYALDQQDMQRQAAAEPQDLAAAFIQPKPPRVAA